MRCSREQTILAQGLGNGHTKWGCSISASRAKALRASTGVPHQTQWSRARIRRPRIVLVHLAGHTTYVAERHLEPDTEEGPVAHPLLADAFGTFRDGRYTLKYGVQ